MSKDVKSLPGEGIGWRWEGEAGGSARPSCPSAEFLLHLGRSTLRTFHRGHISVMKMNCRQEICRNDWKRTSFKRLFSFLPRSLNKKRAQARRYRNLLWVISEMLAGCGRGGNILHLNRLCTDI